MSRFYNEFNFALTRAQRHERNELCERVVLASQLFEMPVSKITQALFMELPEDHWLLSSMWGRKSFERQLEHLQQITKYHNK